MDFSKPVDSSKDSIDISTDKITTPIRLPDNVPRLNPGVLWISDGVMHMLPGEDISHKGGIADEDGNIISMNPPNLTNRVWNFDLKSQKWDVQVSGVENRVDPAIVFDTETQVGWYYGGQNDTTGFQDLYRLDRGVATPIRVETNSSLVGAVRSGMLTYRYWGCRRDWYFGTFGRWGRF